MPQEIEKNLVEFFICIKHVSYAHGQSIIEISILFVIILPPGESLRIRNGKPRSSKALRDACADSYVFCTNAVHFSNSFPQFVFVFASGSVGRLADGLKGSFFDLDDAHLS